MAAGPPELLPRLLAPLLALSVVTALGTGVALFVQHSRGGTLSTLHTDASVCSAALIGLHVLTYAADALATVGPGVALAPLAPCVHPPGSRRCVRCSSAPSWPIVTYSAGVWPQRSYDRRDGNGFPLHSQVATIHRAAAKMEPRLL